MVRLHSKEASLVSLGFRLGSGQWDICCDCPLASTVQPHGLGVRWGEEAWLLGTAHITLCPTQRFPWFYIWFEGWVRMEKVFPGTVIYWLKKWKELHGENLTAFIWPRDTLSTETGLGVLICLEIMAWGSVWLTAIALFWQLVGEGRIWKTRTALDVFQDYCYEQMTLLLSLVPEHPLDTGLVMGNWLSK